MIESMGGSCCCCGYNKCQDALEFHHLDPEQKDLSFGSRRANPASWERLVAELRKCILVCSNCHKEIHAGARTPPENHAVFDERFADYKKIERAKFYDSCPICGNEKHIKKTTCSPTCASQSKRKVDWDQYNLVAMKKQTSFVKMAKFFKVSDVAVKKQYLKQLKQSGVAQLEEP